jgi:hypothetical protein
MLSMYCTASMLPCGRYYYAPEGGYVGNPWVKFSYQYAYLYMAWIVHHLDLIEHYGFQFVRNFARKCFRLYTQGSINGRYRYVTSSTFSNFSDTKVTAGLTFNNNNYNNAWSRAVKKINR